MPVPGEETLTADADYGLLGIRPEAIESVPLVTRDALRCAAQDEVLSFLGKRAIRPVTAIDYGLKRAIIFRACDKAMLHRGSRPSNQDKLLLEGEAKIIEAWLDKVRLGLVEPYFTDSTPAVDEMGPLAGSTRLSDERLRSCRRYPRRACGCR